MARKRARDVESTKEESNSDALQRIQKLLRVIQKSESGAANNQPASTVQDATVTNQASQTEAACISGIDSTIVQGAAVGRAHSCEYHLEWMDPLLWSTLPSELIVLIFGRLSIAKIMELCALSMQCSTMCKSFNFRKVFAERHPKLFELVGRDKVGDMLCDVVYDVRCIEPTSSQATGWASPFIPFPFGPPGQAFSFRRVHDFSEYVLPSRQSDGGLVCFVPRQKLLHVPILVGNPSADEWKALPCIPLVNKKTKWDPVRVQLVMNGGTMGNRVEHRVIVEYRVIVVFYHPTTKAYIAYCFDSRTGVWRAEESSLSYGDGCSRLLMIGGCGNQYNFDRITKMLYDLVYCSSLKGAEARTSAMVKDRLFVLHHQWPIDRSLHSQ